MNTTMFQVYKHYKSVFKNTGALMVLCYAFFISCDSYKTHSGSIQFGYPADGTIFPPEFPPPTYFWNATDNTLNSWQLTFSDSEKKNLHQEHITGTTRWTPSPETWDKLKKQSFHKPVSVVLSAVNKKLKALPADTISFSFSVDSVGAPIFFRSVPLPFKFARENLAKVQWKLGNVGSNEQPVTVLSDIPVCGNCHSFSADGKTLAMDVDARDEKGAYAIVNLKEKSVISEKEIINWSDFVNGEFTYGLLSQISPDSRYVVSTLKDCEIFVDRNNVEYSQLFFPFKGILAVYDRFERKYFELEGANDTNYVHSNPSWGPQGKYIYFTKSTAVHLNESGIFRGSEAINFKVYNKFLNDFLDRKKLFKFDIYRIPFNDGKGGKAEPVPGASENGMSNYFPRFTNDGKWMIYCQAESFMLLMPDSKLYIKPVEGGEARLMNCNTKNMNSWHSLSPNNRWMVFSSKTYGPYTQLLLTHIDENGIDSPPVFLEYFASDKRAANIPEFVNIDSGQKIEIIPEFLDDDAFSLRMGEIKLKEKLYKESLPYFNKSISINAKNHKAYNGKANALMMLLKPDEAILNFNKAIELSPENDDYLLNRGNAFLTLNEDNKALEDFNRAIRFDSLNFMAYNNRGMLWRKKREYEKALTDFDRSIQLNPESSLTYINRAIIMAIFKKYNEALNDFNQSIQLNPQDVSAYFGKAKVFQELGENNKALEEYSIAVTNAPENPQTYYNRAILLIKMNNKSAAANDLQVAADMNYQPAKDMLSRSF